MSDNEIVDFLEQKKILEKEKDLNKERFYKPVLFHGMNYEFFEKLIEKQKMPPKTSQRFWSDGRYLKDNHPDYEKSGWMFGWSMSRSKELAACFGEVLIVFDRKKLEEDFKIKTLSWSFRNSASEGRVSYKKEREDFVIGTKINKTFKEMQEDYSEAIFNLEIEQDEYRDFRDYAIKSNKHKNIDLRYKDYIIGFYLAMPDQKIRKGMFDNYKYLENNKLFLGFFSKEKMKKQNDLQDSYVYKPKSIEYKIKKEQELEIKEKKSKKIKNIKYK